MRSQKSEYTPLLSASEKKYKATVKDLESKAVRLLSERFVKTPGMWTRFIGPRNLDGIFNDVREQQPTFSLAEQLLTTGINQLTMKPNTAYVELLDIVLKELSKDANNEDNLGINLILERLIKIPELYLHNLRKTLVAMPTAIWDLERIPKYKLGVEINKIKITKARFDLINAINTQLEKADMERAKDSDKSGFYKDYYFDERRQSDWITRFNEFIKEGGLEDQVGRIQESKPKSATPASLSSS